MFQNQVLNANSVIQYRWNSEYIISLVISVDLQETTLVTFHLNINDSANYCCFSCSGLCYYYYLNDNLKPVNTESTCNIEGYNCNSEITDFQAQIFMNCLISEVKSKTE